jgi:hypothetical protein
MAFLSLHRSRNPQAEDEAVSERPMGAPGASAPESANGPASAEAAAPVNYPPAPARSSAPASAPAPAVSRAVSRRAGLGAVGFLIVLVGAWGGTVPYIGPTFGYQSNGMSSWQWNLQHSLLYLVPGAVAVAAGFMLIASGARASHRPRRMGAGLLGLIVFACGCWFVLGPVVWPLFYSNPIFGPASARDNFVNQLGYNLGPGLVLVVLSGIAIAVATGRSQVTRTAMPITASEATEEPWAKRRSA